MSESAPAAERLRLLIVDDQPLIRRALAMTLGVESDIEVVGQAVRQATGGMARIVAPVAHEDAARCHAWPLPLM